jgi:hypothetical protein
MIWLRSHRRSAWICGLTLLLPVVFYVNTLFGLWGLHRDYQSNIDHLIPRIARQYGLIEHEDELRHASNLASRQVSTLVYPATGDTASVSTTLQSDIRQIFSDAGLTVSNSQVLPLREQEHFDHININFSVQGDISGVDAALTDIAKFRPLLLVESLEMRPLRSGRSGAKEQIVVVSLQLLALRAIL